MGFRIDQIVLRQIRLPLVHFFETSFGRTTERAIILAEVRADGVSGWGEITCGEKPFYNEEWTDSAWLLIRDFLAPKLLANPLESAAEAAGRTSHIRGHRMAQGGVEAAIWDLEARLHNQPLWKFTGGTRSDLSCGVSIGIQDSVLDLLRKIDVELEAGYQRIKLKIKPGWDLDILREVRRALPDIVLSVDANSAYRLEDARHLRKLDEFKLLMIEQPLDHDDIIGHAELQPQLQTPICLDESIRTVRHAEQAIRLGACRILNIKLGRVGGFTEARKVHDLAQQNGIPVWCGGMLESGIGRAANIAMSTWENFRLPGDVSASKRYWKEDIIEPEVTVSPKGTITPPSGPGLGFEIKRDFMGSLTERHEVLTA